MSIALLFPGQGSQIPGMLDALPDHPAVTQTLDEVSEYLNTDILELDSEEALRSSVSVQLALLACGVSMARALTEEGVVPEAVAGLSVGAFAAAALSGVISLSDAVCLVRQRAAGRIAGPLQAANWLGEMAGRMREGGLSWARGLSVVSGPGSPGSRLFAPGQGI